MVLWKPPEKGMVKLNTNNIVSIDDGSTAYGGVVREVEGNWIFKFGDNIGQCSILGL